MDDQRSEVECIANFSAHDHDRLARYIEETQGAAPNYPIIADSAHYVITAGSVSDEQARKLFGGWRAPKPYIRIAPQPRERES